MKIRLFCIAFCLLQFSVGNSQENNPVIIAGKIQGEIQSVSAIKIYYFDKYIAIGETSHRIDTTIEIGVEGNFKFKLPSNKIGKIAQLVIFYIDSANPGNHDVLENYVVEPSDRINFVIRVKDYWVTEIRVTGNGAAKYQCRSNIILKNLQLKKERWEREDSINQERKNPDMVINQSIREKALFKDLTKLLTLHTLLDSMMEPYKDNIYPFVYKLMKADLTAENHLTIEKTKQEIFSLALNCNDSTEKENTRMFLLSHHFYVENPSEKVIALAPAYVEYIYEKEVTNLSLEKGIDYRQIRLSYTDLFNRLLANYKGELRERLLTALLVNAQQNAGLIAMGRKRDKYINEALALIKNAEFRNRIKNAAIFKVLEGIPSYKFNLPDPSGKFIKLDDLKGNVVLMDIWFTGCTGCVVFSQKIKTQIKPAFKGNQQLKFLSINTDPDKTMWLKSLASGRYTETSNINLQARQPSLNSKSFYQIPIIKHYGLNYLPFILLIDRKGNIVHQFTNSDKIDDIILTIQKTIVKE